MIGSGAESVRGNGLCDVPCWFIPVVCIKKCFSNWREEMGLCKLPMGWLLSPKTERAHTLSKALMVIASHLIFDQVRSHCR